MNFQLTVYPNIPIYLNAVRLLFNIRQFPALKISKSLSGEQAVGLHHFSFFVCLLSSSLQKIPKQDSTCFHGEHVVEIVPYIKSLPWILIALSNVRVLKADHRTTGCCFPVLTVGCVAEVTSNLQEAR